MLFMLENCSGVHVRDFDQKDIQPYKELLLMRMLTSDIFNLLIHNLDDRTLGKEPVYLSENYVLTRLVYVYNKVLIIFFIKKNYDAGPGETEFISLLPNNKIEDCKVDIDLGIREGMRRLEGKSYKEIQVSTDVENVRIRYKLKRRLQAISEEKMVPKDIEAQKKPPELPVYIPPDFVFKDEARKTANLLKRKTFQSKHGQ